MGSEPTKSVKLMDAIHFMTHGRRAETGSLYIDDEDIRVADHQPCYGRVKIQVLIGEHDHIDSTYLEVNVDRFGGNIDDLADAIMGLAYQMVKNFNRDDE
jgi:hypothetical protein